MDKELDDLRRTVATLAAESEIRRVMATHQRLADAGTDDGAFRAWDTRDVSAPPTPLEPGPFGDPFPARDALYAKELAWRGTGLRGGGFDGTARWRFADPIPDDVPLTDEWMPRMMHFLTNEAISVDVHAGTAVGRWYSWEAATVRVDGALTSIWIAGRYEVAFVREEGSWRILELHFEEVFSTPFDSPGWVVTPHVRYGPRAVRG